MKRLFFALVLVGAGIVGLGFYRGWFHVGSDKADGNSNVTFSMDTNKFQQDSKSAVADVKGLGHQIKDKAAARSEKTMDGTLVNVNGDKLTMTNQEGKEHSHTLATKITVTCDGKTCTAADLKAGMRIRVTTEDAAPHAACRIEALDKDAAFASSGHDGRVVSISGSQLVMTNMDGKGEHTCTLSGDVKVTCDGTLCKASELKPGMRIRVTSAGADSHAVTQIEALDKDLEFRKGA